MISLRFSRIKELISKGIYCLRHEGFSIFAQRTYLYIFKRNKRPKTQEAAQEAATTCADVLFISGCALPHPARYRVFHQRQQLAANGMISLEVFYTDLTLDMVKNFRVFIFFRCEITSLIEKFVNVAKDNNKLVIFDVDDLVIDTKYTDTVSYLDTMSKVERRSYDKHVRNIQKLLKKCHAATTTTHKLAEALSDYVPKVFINRNVASDHMALMSLRAMYDRDEMPFVDYITLEPGMAQQNYENAVKSHKERKGKLRIGYFSGSITHNEDFEMIKPAILKLLNELPNLELVLVGELTLPKDLRKYNKRIIFNDFVDWTRLPWLIASVDINLAPLKNTIFNEAKSENKWLEAALVEVPTIACNIGAFAYAIEDGVTGILCEDNPNDWYKSIKMLLSDEVLRKDIGKNAREFVMKKYLTINTGMPLCNFIKSQMTPNIAFVLPSLQISGGVLVALKHCATLKRAGYDVTVLCDDFVGKNPVYNKVEIPAISKYTTGIHQTFSACVATLWTTLSFCQLYPNIKHRLYLVQGFEVMFYQYGDSRRVFANATYNMTQPSIEYLTVSKWCQDWLADEYNKKAAYIPNGLDIKKFPVKQRTFSESKKIRILVEGNSEDHFKNIDESFQIVKKLDLNKYEIWYMSYHGKPKDWYHVDKFLHKIPNDEVAEIYGQCHILLKSSIFESFSYPPLEMMATGGIALVRPNDGNSEYLQDGVNCLFYRNVKEAVMKIEEIAKNEKLRENLIKNGLETAKSRSWQNIEDTILDVYTAYL